MKPFKKAFIFLIFFSFFCNISTLKAENFINYDIFTLENGLTVAVIPQKRVPVVTHMIWYKAGLLDEPAGKSGLAHFNEHLMFRGSKNIPDGEFSKIVAQNGGEDNAFTSRAYTAYHQTIASNRLELVMAMEAERMQSLLLTQDVFDTEHKVIIEERLSRYDNSPSGILSERMRLALWPSDNNGVAVIGHMNEIKSLTLEDVTKFHQTWYAPNNAYVVIAGDIDVDTAKKLAKKYYGKLKPKKLPARKEFELPPEDLAISITLPHFQVNQKSMQRYYAIPQETDKNEKQDLAFSFLSEILGNSTIGRLFTSLVKEQKIASAAGCFYDPSHSFPNLFGFYGYPRDDNVKLEDLDTAIIKEISKIADGDITEEEISKVKQRIIASMVYLGDNHENLAHLAGEILVSGQKLEEINELPQKMQEITKEDVIGAADYLINHTATVRGFLVPKSKEQNNEQ